MTKTTQLRSWTALSEAGKDLTIKKAETKDTCRIMYWEKNLKTKFM
ncbi:MAG: hypothetical protein LBC76_00915 [Treponema sp.]|nr:hypothetical protein [Treponema sp.]